MSNDVPARHQSTVGGVHRLVERQVKATPDAVAIVDADYEITYGELDARANQLAHYLVESFDCRSKSVAFCLERTPELPAAALAVLKAGAACVPIDASYPPSRRAHMLQISRAVALITTAALARSFSEFGIPILTIDTAWPEISDRSEGTLAEDSAPSDPCYVIFTSGSTGMPKGVVMPHGAIENLISWHLSSPNAPGDYNDGRTTSATTLQFAPITFDVSFQEIFVTWAVGGTLALVPEHIRLDPDALLAHMIDLKVERLFLPVVMLIQLAESVARGGPLPTVLRDVITAGESLRITPAVRSLFEALPSCRLHNHYGPSETHVVTSYRLTGRPAAWPLLPPIGKAIDNTALHILDERGQPTPTGGTGELYIGGACLAAGYADNPDLTAERFVEIDISDSGVVERLYKSGDLVRFNDGGELEYLGRADQQIKVRGYRIEPGEIEEALKTHREVADAVVTAVAYEEGELTLNAFIVPQGAHEPSAGNLRAHLRDILPDYMIPVHYQWIPTLPLTSSGKIDRKSLAESLSKTAAAGTKLPEISGYKSAGDAVASLWKVVLHSQEVGADDNFFEVGGTSIQAIKLHRQLRDALRIEFPITDLFEHPTIEKLSRHLSGLHSVDPSDLPLVPAAEPTGDRLASIQRLRAHRKG